MALSLDPILCNKIIKQEFINGNPKQAILTYIDMQENGFNADNYTYPILLKLGINTQFKFALHAQIIKTGFHDHVFVQTALLNMYSFTRRIDSACRVFKTMSQKDLIAWNSMLGAYVSYGKIDDAVKLFDEMPCKDVLSFNTIISGYARNGDMLLARKLFDEMPVRDVVSWNSVILACANAKEMNQAKKLFDLMPDKNVISWNTMINGYLSCYHFSKTVDFFNEMIDSKFEPDYISVSGALCACAHLGSLETGVKILVYASNRLLSSDLHVIASLIDMYAKCGSIKRALVVFYKSKLKDIYCWNAIISGLALHGYGNAAIDLFKKMGDSECPGPDDITFISLLSACSHSNLVEDGCIIFNSMKNDHGITPKLEHYGCMVDLLSRAGFLDYAIRLTKTMPFEPRESIYGALLSACVTHCDIENGRKVAKLMSESERVFCDGEFMMMANLYASVGQWEESDRWRSMMNDSGIVKAAGCSVIEVGGKCCKFLAGEIDTD